MSRTETISSCRDRVTQVAESLERSILTGRYRVGDTLPPERELVVLHGVSRSVVREAIGRLASAGLVRSVHGSGNVVKVPDGKLILRGYERLLLGGGISFRHLGEIRLALETVIAGSAARHRTEEHVERLEEAQQILGNPRRSLDSHVEADLAFHGILMEATGNPLFRLVLAPIQELLIKSRRKTLGRYGSEIAHAHHAAILDAVRQGDEVGASAAMGHHLNVSIAQLET